MIGYTAQKEIKKKVQIDLILHLGIPELHELKQRITLLTGVGCHIGIHSLDPPTGLHSWQFDSDTLSLDSQAELALILLNNWHRIEHL